MKPQPGMEITHVGDQVDNEVRWGLISMWFGLKEAGVLIMLEGFFFEV